MGRIIASVEIANMLQPDKKLICDALVDTGAALMVLPSAWRERLGDFLVAEEVDMESATQETVRAVICGPVRLKIEAFRPIVTEVAFVDMVPDDGDYEPLLGYIPLEQCQAAVDMLGHRLVYVKALDLK